MAACNINYSKENYLRLATDLKLLFNLINRPGIEDRIIKTLEYKYKSKAGEDKRILLTGSEDLDETSKTFIDDVNNIICGLANTSLDNLPEKALKFKNIILSTFFDMNNVEEGHTIVSEQLKELQTDENKEAIKLQKVEDALLEIYGPINTGLIQEVTNDFGRELKLKLIYNDYLKTKYELSPKEVNERIIKYKEGKFERIVSYLKQLFPNDSILQSISTMYTNGMLNSSQYYYVLDKFKKLAVSDGDRNAKFNFLLENKVLLKNKLQQEFLYRQLIDFIQKNASLKTWFNNKYSNNYINNEAKTQLFLANRFSNYYLEIKDKLLKEIERGASYKKEVLDLINLIENPKNDFLNYVNDYVLLSCFDDILSLKLGDNIGIEKGFLNNIEPLRLDAQKYIIRKSKKHLSAGWETLGNEGSELHTSSNVKDMIDTIFIYKYNELHLLIPQPLTMTSLMEAWLSLIADTLNNKINFNLEDNKAIIETLKDYINTQNVNVLDNIINILELLFKPYYLKGSRGRMIDFLSSSGLLNEQHKNILYSFYNAVLNKDNPGSNIYAELNRINSSEKYSKNFLETVSDLCAVLYRNVNNNYIDCNLQPSKSTFTIKLKFNWDSDLFDLVERISFLSKVRQNNKLGSDRLDKYNYKSIPDSAGSFISKVELKGKGDTLYTLGFKYELGSTNLEGLFSSLNNLQLEDTKVNINGKDTSILDVLSQIDLMDFKNKVLTNKELLNEYETLFNNLLKMFDYYLDTNLLSDVGLDALYAYKKQYVSDPKNGLFSKNYLNHFLKLSLRVADIDNQVRLAGDLDLKHYLLEGSKYTGLFNRESNLNTSSIFDIQGNKVYFKAVTTKDKALSDLVRCNSIVSGKASRSTSLNKAGSSVSNYSISRLGSELNRRLHKQLKLGGVYNSLLFVQNPNSIDIDPIIDSEVTTPIGDVKSVKDMSSSELFLHAILDKFYNSYLKNKKVSFLPTVYSDKTNFLNYLSNLSMFSEGVMDLMNDRELEFIDLYRGTFFSAHNQILVNIVSKFEKLMQFLDTEAGINFKLPNDIFDSNRLDNVRKFLRNRTSKQLLSLVYTYNQNNVDKIELEADKDFRDRKEFCDLNEIVDFYAKLYNDPTRLKIYIYELLKLFIENLEEYGVSFKLFDSKNDLNSWINGSLNDKNLNLITRILSDSSILKNIDREKFAKEWINLDTGEFILSKNNKMNPFLLKFFYIEGLFSNNLRLSLSGSEINHPDKAKNTLFNRIGKVVSTILEETEKENNDVQINIARKKLEVLLTDNNIPFLSLDSFITEFSSYKAINDLDGNPNMLDIYDKTIIEIINTAEGTQFKRNVIIPATLLHPLTGLINGVANQVNVAVVKDMPAPVNNLRESDSIDSLDGSSTMSPIQVILENNSLGDLRVGTNRKPIWDDQTDDLTSFLAKFASFGLTNAMMLQSLESNSALYNMFKKMHNIRWNKTIDLTKNINQFELTLYDLEEVSRWFKEAILLDLKLFYKNQFGNIVEIVDFGRDNKGYFTVESILGKGTNKVYHYFSDLDSEHSTVGGEGYHDIDSLYELFVSLGGINCTDAKGNISEFSNQVLTNFVINVGYKTTAKVTSTKDIVQPLKDKFIAYVFNSSAVKNGAKNVNSSDAWMDNSPLNTFKLNIQGLGIQLNADHDVVDSELTEFSLVVAACAAYGKDFKSINEIYYSLGESAFLASELELTNISRFFKDYAEDPSKAKYKLYKIVGKLIVLSKSNNDMDLTERIKLEIRLEFKTNRDSASSELKIPFSDPSIYTLFITNITSVINSKSIKRKHPGSGYVMAPGYNVVQYFLLYDQKTRTYRKYMFLDILKRARNDFRGKLINKLELWCIANNIDPNKYGDRGRKIYNFDLPTLLLETQGKINPEELPYLAITTQDTTKYNSQLVDLFLSSKQANEPIRDKSWFMPTDIVQVITPTGKLGEPIDLSDMLTYYDFKNRTELEGTKFQLCLTRPNNLKPSFIRWLYIDPADGILKFMNIYDHPIIRGSWNLPKSLRPKQAQIQLVLDLLDLGKFELNGLLIDIIPDSLENTEAEIVLGNMYKDIFLTGDNSLADIMDLGEDFFRKLTTIPKIPTGFYNLAFVKNNGQHTLISFSNINETLNVYEDPFDHTLEYINDDNEIYTHKDGIKIGKYIPSSWEYIDGKVLDKNKQEVDKSKYRLIYDENGNVLKVLKRVDYIKRFKYTKSNLVNGENLLITYTLYRVAPVQEIREALDKKSNDLDVLNSDAYHLISKILEDIYKLDKYLDIQVNTSIDLNRDLRRVISSSLVSLGNDTKYDLNTNKRVLMTNLEIKLLPRFLQHIIELRNALLQDSFEEDYKDIKLGYYESLLHYKQQYSSFLNSLHFISSRIPAQSLQSFMPMICVGWTLDTSNTAYVSYILTYLQGSDYDIDKAYVMGQSFNDDGIYIGWSPLFNYSSYKTIEASKFLPVPRGLKLLVSENPEHSIENELNLVINSRNSASRIKNLANLIYKIDNNKGRYNYLTDSNAEEKERILKLIQYHENYKVTYNQRELAYKNVASANIRNVVHNIRNRDLAYSPITMKDLQSEADKSPKGAKTKLLNMINPLTKYIMLNQNLVGKNVIGIAANGEKDWFNLTYYYHNILRKGNQKDLFYLKMNHSYSRILGRASWNLENINIKHIPDLWNADLLLANKLKELFYLNYDGIIDYSDKYVDLLISQLLSAATDNAKELILAKINAGTNLAKYYLHMIIMGFKLNDIVSFMTSPVVELIDKYSRNDLYLNQFSSVNKAIKLLNGDIDLSKLIVKPSENLSAEEKMGAMEALLEAMEAEAEMMMEMLAEGRTPRRVNNEYGWVISLLGSMYTEAESKSLKDFIKKYIQAKTQPISNSSPEYMKKLARFKLPKTDNMNTNYVFKYIDLIINDVNTLIEAYNKLHPNSNYSLLDFKLDLNEFTRITDEANETSNLASVWLKLNQGIPQTDIELIKRVKRMNSTISGREYKMGIKKLVDINKITFVDLQDTEEDYLTTNTSKEDMINAIRSYNGNPGRDKSSLLVNKIFNNIKGNNPELNELEIKNILIDAINADLYGNFDIYKYLNNDMVKVSQDSPIQYNTRLGDLVSYRELAADYYNLIKSSWNILDIMNRIPHYKVSLDLLNYTLLLRHLFANKSKILDQLISLGELSYSALTDKDYKNIVLYADKILVTSYFLSKSEPIDISKVPNTKVFDSDYLLVKSDELYLNSLNGIDSLKNFVENDFYEWLKTNYPDNYLVKELVLSSNRGKSALRTALNLFDVDLSLPNKLTYNKYLLGVSELANEKFNDNYSVADILMLYNLAVNGTKLGGKYMTGVFRDLVVKGDVLYDYYLFMANSDYSSNFKYILPTKRDFLIAIAPTVYSLYALNYRTEPYVKVLNPLHGYDVYRRYYDRSDYSWKYTTNPILLLQLDSLGLTPDLINDRLYNYTLNSLTMFPELHRRLKESSAFFEQRKDVNNTEKLIAILAQYIRLNRLLIYKLC